jgi:DNA-binding MurR/RpiR family transcriptional regulator
MGMPRWTTRMLAQRTGLSQSTVVRIAAKLRDGDHAFM